MSSKSLEADLAFLMQSKAPFVVVVFLKKTLASKLAAKHWW